MTATASPTALTILSLMNLKGVGRRAALKIVDTPVSETDPDGSREALMPRVPRSHRKRVSKAGFRNAWAKSEEQLDKGQNDGIRAISFHDAEYPDRLKTIPDPPAVLFVKGKTDALHAMKSVAVIGTRGPTKYGTEIAQKSARVAVEAAFVIVSGLAHGCDTYAHESCLEAKGIGVAVLAHGLERVYPAENRGLAERLLETGGCLVSEYPVGMKVIRNAFAERDRIQSGLSDAVFLVETDVDGGAMHTVRFAHTQKRKIACYAHPVWFFAERKTRGNRKLIKDGWATAIPNGEALTRFLNGVTAVASNDAIKEADNDYTKPQLSLAL